jgi:hypothetical protein
MFLPTGQEYFKADGCFFLNFIINSKIQQQVIACSLILSA